jgi:hypothetical protein
MTYGETCQFCGRGDSNGVVCKNCLGVQEPAGFRSWDEWEHSEYLVMLERAYAWHDSRGDVVVGDAIYKAWKAWKDKYLLDVVD